MAGCPPSLSLRTASPLLAALLSAPAPGAGAADGLVELGNLGGSYLTATAVSAAGTAVVGEGDDAAFNPRAFLWTPAAGTVNLGVLNGGDFSTATACNSDCTVIVGQANDGAAGGQPRAFRWTAGGGMVSLGTLPGGLYSFAAGVNTAGDVVVGYAGDGAAANAGRAFRWTAGSGLVNLGVLNGGSASAAAGVNAAGDVVVGQANDGAAGDQTRAFRWTAGTGMVSLGVLNGADYSVATAVNAAGDVVVGAADDGAAGNQTRAFRWTAATGIVSLGVLHGGTFSSASAVNAAGDVVVGYGFDGAAGGVSRGFRWSQASGLQTIEEWLAAHGVAVNPAAPKTFNANGVSADGTVVVGVLDNNQSYLARATSGLIDLAQFNRSLAANAGVAGLGLREADLALHGAHGSPLRGLPARGRQNVWLAGDWGRGDRSADSGSVAAGEFGYSRGLADGVVIRAALGRSDGDRATPFGGKTRTQGAYLLPELTVRLGASPFFATLSGYANRGEAKIARGYVNAGLPALSRGRPDTRSEALRLRLDWFDAATLGPAAFTPYASLSRLRSRVDAYSESGGGFPARWERRSEHSTQVRLGIDAVYRAGGGVNFVGRLEAARRSDARAADTRGEVSGLFPFTFQGEAYRRQWLRAAVGVEAAFGQGSASLTVNATSQGATPSYWLAAAYRWDF